MERFACGKVSQGRRQRVASELAQTPGTAYVAADRKHTSDKKSCMKAVSPVEAADSLARVELEMKHRDFARTSLAAEDHIRHQCVADVCFQLLFPCPLSGSFVCLTNFVCAPLRICSFKIIFSDFLGIRSRTPRTTFDFARWFPRRVSSCHWRSAVGVVGFVFFARWCDGPGMT